MSLGKAEPVIRQLTVTKLNSGPEIEQVDRKIVVSDDITTCMAIIFSYTGMRAKTFRNDRDR